MSDRELERTAERQDALTAAEQGELHWFNPGGLGGSYISREVFVHQREGRHPVDLLMQANALVHAEHIMVGHQGRHRVRITAAGMKLLEKWRSRPL
jgi:hypothetical protein